MTKRKRSDDDTTLDPDYGRGEMLGGSTEGTTADEEHSGEPSYCKISDVKLGDSLMVLGDEVDCMHDGETKEVKQNANGRLYVECEEGKHYLDRVTDMHDYVLGLGVKPAKTV